MEHGEQLGERFGRIGAGPRAGLGRYVTFDLATVTGGQAANGSTLGADMTIASFTQADTTNAVTSMPTAPR